MICNLADALVVIEEQAQTIERLRASAHNSDYAKCPHFATFPMFNEDTGQEEPLHICTSGGHFA